MYVILDEWYRLILNEYKLSVVLVDFLTIKIYQGFLVVGVDTIKILDNTGQNVKFNARNVQSRRNNK